VNGREPFGSAGCSSPSGLVAARGDEMKRATWLMPAIVGVLVGALLVVIR
jgi:hypothetical protein